MKPFPLADRIRFFTALNFISENLKNKQMKHVIKGSILALVVIGLYAFIAVVASAS
jgi:hypothetical protein